MAKMYFDICNSAYARQTIKDETQDTTMGTPCCCISLGWRVPKGCGLFDGRASSIPPNLYLLELHLWWFRGASLMRIQMRMQRVASHPGHLGWAFAQWLGDYAWIAWFVWWPSWTPFSASPGGGGPFVLHGRQGMAKSWLGFRKRSPPIGLTGLDCGKTPNDWLPRWSCLQPWWPSSFWPPVGNGETRAKCWIRGENRQFGKCLRHFKVDVNEILPYCFGDGTF